MTLQPLYSNHLLSAAYQLRYTWTGWPSADSLFPSAPENLFVELDKAWETDGLRRLEMNWTSQKLQFTFSVKPTVSPVFFVSRVKGRLQHALRIAGTPVKFSRKVAFRAIGDNHTEDVERYIQNQVNDAHFIDPRFAETLQPYTVTDSSVDLTAPTATDSGRYWYNLHLVFVVAQRLRFKDAKSLATLSDGCQAIANKHGYEISVQSVMPDHLHLALRGNIEHSPEDISLSLMNNLAFMMGQNPIWQSGYYSGTFGEYDMNAVRDDSG